MNWGRVGRCIVHPSLACLDIEGKSHVISRRRMIATQGTRVHMYDMHMACLEGHLDDDDDDMFIRLSVTDLRPAHAGDTYC